MIRDRMFDAYIIGSLIVGTLAVAPLVMYGYIKRKILNEEL